MINTKQNILPEDSGVGHVLPSRESVAHRHGNIAPKVPVKDLERELSVQQAAELDRGTEMSPQGNGGLGHVVYHLCRRRGAWYTGASANK